ncbi:hypothetical protein D1BOALGB6SA_5133 [Olavius sp. associated proteobacterium Delta 1]|nr:hypothetical protein D1BOALGB6SA_5133 [Olavius sp. associated proteobacterium Delta 1]
MINFLIGGILWCTLNSLKPENIKCRYIDEILRLSETIQNYSGELNWS